MYLSFLKGGSADCLLLAVSSVIPLLHVNFTSITTFSLYAVPSSLLANSLFQLSILGKCLCLLLGHREAKWLYALLYVCERNNRCAVTHDRHTLREVTWWVTDGGMHLILHSDLWTGASFYFIHTQLIYHDNQNLNYVVREQVLLN